MSTYATYKVWAGILIAQVDVNNQFIKEVLFSGDGVKKDNLLFENIGMHGEDVGIGVQIQELNWEVEIGDSNLYDVMVANKAREIRGRVAEIFKRLGISVVPRLYHHIDLGG